MALRKTNDKKKDMKTLLCVALLTASLAACDNNSDSAATNTEPATE
jgi:hypothetical protein